MTDTKQAVYQADDRPGVCQPAKKEKSQINEGWRQYIIPYNLLYIPVFIAIILKFANGSGTAQFILACFGLIPLAGMVGDSTEELGELLGDVAGGILSASFGNAPELIFSSVSLYKGFDDLIKASLIGSILSNTLLVLGTSLIVGGVKNGIQEFKSGIVHSAGATWLVVSGMFLSTPSILNYLKQDGLSTQQYMTIDLFISIILVAVYISYTLFQIRYEGDKTEHRVTIDTADVNRILERKDNDQTIELKIINVEANITVPEKQASDNNEAVPNVYWSIFKLLFASCLVALLSDIVTDTISEITSGGSISQTFIGIIIIAITGNAAEHWTAMKAAYDNEADLSITTVLTSGLQISMLIIPLMVIFSYVRSVPFTLVFPALELIAFESSAILTWFIVSDSKTNWSEGKALVALYLLCCIAFFYY